MGGRGRVVGGRRTGGIDDFASTVSRLHMRTTLDLHVQTNIASSCSETGGCMQEVAAPKPRS